MRDYNQVRVMIDILVTRIDNGGSSAYIAEIRSGEEPKVITQDGIDIPMMMISLSHRVAPEVYGKKYRVMRGIHPGSTPMRDSELAHLEQAVMYAINDLQAETMPMRRCT